MEENLLIQEEKKKILVWRILTVVLLIIVIVLAILYGLGFGWKEDEKETPSDEEEKPTESILTLWKENSNSKKELVDYIKTITDKNNVKYIPPESRIAVFDFDGTIFCETDTIYFDYFMFSYRVLNDSNYSQIATEEEKILAYDIATAEIHNLNSTLQMRHANAYPHVYENMTYEELEEYTKNYMKLDSPKFNNMKRGEEFYEPMVQVIEYLQANDFEVYICSGGDRHIYRTLARSRLNIPESHVIGTIATVAASGQLDRSDSGYEFKEDDTLIVGGEFKYKNVKMNKVSLIKTEIGKRPVLSFGNSNGDYSMAKYASSNKEYEGRAFMLCCDDLDREYGDEAKAQKIVVKCDGEPKWIAVSMKNDWERIYPEGVTKKYQN